MNTDEIKEKIVEEILFKDESQVDYKIQNALELLDNVNHNCDGYYIFDEWNEVKAIENLTGLSMDDILDDMWTFSDSAVFCDHCQEVIYLNDYHTVDYWVDYDNGEFICGDCIRDNEDFANEYIEAHINDHLTANTILNLSDYGFKVCECEDDVCNFWSGLYQGANDEPEQILKNAIDINPDNDYIFDITDINPFAVTYTLYHKVKNDE